MDSDSTTPRIPTINDLRVDVQIAEDPPRAWTHPCTCTLVAHESCLLQWIQASQANVERASKALKCPQCGTKYELVSKKPYILHLIGAGNRFLQRVGRMVTLVGGAGIIGVFASGVSHVSLNAKVMYDLLLTDDPANWRWTTFINLPSIPFALILSRFQSPRLIPSIIPILLLWPPIPPIHIARNSSPFAPSSFLPTDLRISRPLSTGLWSWPPTPALFGFLIIPAVRFAYRTLWKRLQAYVLGSVPPSARHRGNTFVLEGWPVVVRFQGRVVRGNGEGQNAGQQGAIQAEGAGAVGAGPQGGADQGVNLEAQIADVDHDDDDDDAADPQPQPIPQNALEAAEQAIAVMRSSLGRRVGGALLVPWISARMGALLLAASKHWSLLRRILAVKPPLSDVLSLVPKSVQEEGLMGRLQKTLGTVWRSTMRGSTTWAEADPVWWRNAIGLGIFVVAKDTVELVHLYLATREIESRHVKNRDFAGIDIGELDLVPGFLRTAPAARPQTQQRAQSLPRGL
ncbi:hypothetical protein H0H92_003642 [Tricholoma furcatifolium]|nr:hypothetical protein H0H92_003642 [Tricholoma furcatifolium]